MSYYFHRIFWVSFFWIELLPFFFQSRTLSFESKKKFSEQEAEDLLRSWKSIQNKKTWISSWRVEKAKKWVVHYWEITHACSCHLLDSWDSGLLPRFLDFLFFQPPHAWTLKATTGQGTLEELKKRKAMGTLSLPQDSNLQEDCKDLRSAFKGWLSFLFAFQSLVLRSELLRKHILIASIPTCEGATKSKLDIFPLGCCDHRFYAWHQLFL